MTELGDLFSKWVKLKFIPKKNEKWVLNVGQSFQLLYNTIWKKKKSKKMAGYHDLGKCSQSTEFVFYTGVHFSPTPKRRFQSWLKCFFKKGILMLFFFEATEVSTVLLFLSSKWQTRKLLQTIVKLKLHFCSQKKKKHQ